MEETMSLSLEDQVESFLLSLDSNLTKEYHRAKEVTPGLVRKESDVSDFLRVENNDPQKAATRLANYWKTRKLLFDERWLLPMTQTGLGALTQSQVGIVRSGFLQVVESSNHGMVMLIDFSLLPQGSSTVQAQVVFYFLSIYPRDLTALYVIRSIRDRPPMMVSNLIKRALDSTAARLTNIFVARAFEEGREHLLDYLGFQQRRFTETNLQRFPNGYISSDSLNGTFSLLQQKGFARNCLPPDLGGTMDTSFFDDWVRMRLSVEDVMGASPVNVALVAAASPFSSTTMTIRRRQQRGKEHLALAKRPGETDAEFTKRKNAVYVRRNYHRQKLELMTVEGEVSRCRKLNKSLKTENKRLRKLLVETKRYLPNPGDAGTFNSAPFPDAFWVSSEY